MYKLFFLILVSAFFFFSYMIYDKPPYFYQAKVSYFFDEKEYEHFSSLVESFPPKSRLSYYNDDEIKVMLVGDKKYILEKNKELIRLMKKKSILLITKFEDKVLFSIGTDSKFGKTFQIAFFRIKNFNELELCSDQYKTKPRGACYEPLKADWFLHYEWFED